MTLQRENEAAVQYAVVFVVVFSILATTLYFVLGDGRIASIPGFGNHARLNGQFGEAVRDTNGDGLADELMIRVGIHVDRRVRVGLRGMLSDRKGTVHDVIADSFEFLEPGEHELELRYPARRLYEAAEPGPFDLNTLRLFEFDGRRAAIPTRMQESTEVYRTQAYPRAAFQHEKIQINGTVVAYPVDTDGNGRFEWLVVELGVDIDYPGNYSWQAGLANSGEFADLGFISGHVSGRLAKGSNLLRFEFPGGMIRDASREGPYWLQVIYISARIRGTPPGAPRYAYTGPPVAIPGVPPPDRFEGAVAERVETAQGVYFRRR